ncbi:MAG: glycosyltransferase family 4 protein [Flavobacteriales bacterium]|nr:glycosyltransferase family 4 protein [Flavobacteriales bacterium]
MKWMSYLAVGHTCYLIVRKHHADQMGKEKLLQFEQMHGIQVVAQVEDFSIRRFGRTWKTAQELARIIRANRIEVFHMMYAEPNALWAFFRSMLGVPILLTTRGTDVLKTIPAFYQRKSLLDRLVTYCYRRALLRVDQVTCTSTRQRTAVQELSGDPHKAIELVRTGVPVEWILADTTAHQIPELVAERYVLFPRSMRPIYQHELAIAAIDLLPEDLSRGHLFVFVDRSSSYRDYVQGVQRLIDRSKGRFLWLDHVDQPTMFQLYKRAALVAMTPISDGSPVSALEAMLCKVPVILPPLLYDADLFGAGVVQFKEWTAASLAEAIEAVLRGTLRPDLESAYQTVMERADSRKEMDKVRALYAGMASEKV